MPPPILTFGKRCVSSEPNAIIERGRNNTEKEFAHRAVTHRGQVDLNRFGNTAPSPTLTSRANNPRKRPAYDRHKSKRNKRPRLDTPATQDEESEETSAPTLPPADSPRTAVDAQPMPTPAQQGPVQLALQGHPSQPDHVAFPSAVHAQTSISFVQPPVVFPQPASTTAHQQGLVRVETPGLSALNLDTALILINPPRPALSAISQTDCLTGLVSAGGDALGLPRRGAFSQGDVGLGLETGNQRPSRAEDNRDEALVLPVSHELPVPISRSDVDPVPPLRDAIDDRSVAAEASNAGEGPEETSHHGEASRATLPTIIVQTASDRESDHKAILAGVGQLRIGDDASDEEHVGGDGDGSDDGEYCPRTPSRKARGKKTSPQKSPRSGKRTAIVTLRARPEDLRRISLRPRQRPDIPIGDKCFFFRLPLEARELIYRHLLRARTPIQVLNGWSQLHRLRQPTSHPADLNSGSQPALHPAVLLVCRRVFDEAVRVLYAENEFRYLVRDQAGMVKFRGGGNVSNSRIIAVRKYACYFRKLELRMERNRTMPGYGRALARALEILKDNGADLHTLTIHISPGVEEGESVPMAAWFDQDGPVNAALEALNTCFIQIHVFTPGTDPEDTPGSLRCIIDKRVEVSELEVVQRGLERHKRGSCDTEKEVLRLEIQAEQSDKANRQLGQLSARISSACREPERAVQLGWFEPFEPTRERSRRSC